MKKIDLLIVDIDDTFIYHRTVAAANRLFVDSFCDCAEKDELYTTKKAMGFVLRSMFRWKPRLFVRLMRLSFVALRLHYYNMVRMIRNFFGGYVSCEKMIRLWGKTVVGLKTEADSYGISENAVKKNLNKNILRMYKELRKKNPHMKVLALSEHFAVGKDPLKEILGIDTLVSNRFIVHKGIIADSEIVIKNANDKKRIAEEYVKKYNARSVGMIIDDYDDRELLTMKNIGFIAYKKKLGKYVNSLGADRIVLDE